MYASQIPLVHTFDWQKYKFFFLKKEEMKIQFNHEIALLHLDYTHSHCWAICMIIIAISFHTQQIEWHNNNFTHSTATKSEIFIWQCYENLNKILFSYHRSRMCISAFKPHIQKKTSAMKNYQRNNSNAHSCCYWCVAILWKSKTWKILSCLLFAKIARGAFLKSFKYNIYIW